MITTGPVRASGYAVQLRRAAFGALKRAIDAGVVAADAVNAEVARVNQALYHVLVEEFAVPKDSVVNVTAQYELGDGFRITDVEVEVYKLDADLSGAVTAEARRALSPGSA